MGKPTATQTWAGVVMAALAILSSYLGYDKYEAIQAEAASVTVNFDVDPVAAPIANPNSISLNDVKQLIKSQHRRDLVIFKKKEKWD